MRCLMSIESLGEFDEFHSFCAQYNSIGNWNGKEVEILKSEFPHIWLETVQSNGLSLKNHQIEPTMMKVGVSHVNKKGEKIEGYLEVDIRDPNKQNPPPPPPPQPPAQQEIPKKS